MKNPKPVQLTLGLLRARNQAPRAKKTRTIVVDGGEAGTVLELGWVDEVKRGEVFFDQR